MTLAHRETVFALLSQELRFALPSFVAPAEGSCCDRFWALACPSQPHEVTQAHERQEGCLLTRRMRE